jgi:hypothetical protein
MILQYIGPGLGVATIVIVLIVVAIVFFSFASVITTGIKNLFRKFKK